MYLYLPHSEEAPLFGRRKLEQFNFLESPGLNLTPPLIIVMLSIKCSFDDYLFSTYHTPDNLMLDSTSNVLYSRIVDQLTIEYE